MNAVEYTADKDRFTILVRPRGWLSQWWKLLPAAIILAMQSNNLFHGYFSSGAPEDFVFQWLLWLGGLALAAAALQGAYRRVVFTADAQSLVIATAGPLRRTNRFYPRGVLQAAIVADSTTRVFGRYLKQLQLYFAGHNTPQTMLTGRSEADLNCLAQHLTHWLHLEKNSFSPSQYMEVRRAPLYATLFKTCCAIGVGIGLVLFLLNPVIGMPAVGISFFCIPLAIIVVTTYVMRKARCPQCGEEIRQDSLSREGYMQYTCPTCRIVWQSPIRAGGSRV